MKYEIVARLGMQTLSKYFTDNRTDADRLFHLCSKNQIPVILIEEDKETPIMTSGNWAGRD